MLFSTACGGVVCFQNGCVVLDSVGQVKRLTVSPFSFYEFLRAGKNDFLFEKLKTPSQISPIAHRELLLNLDKYLKVGGLPAVVLEYFLDRDFRQLRSAVIADYEHIYYGYFNWDYTEDRQGLLAGRWQSDDGLIVFDELHKYRNWKNWIKGVYDINDGPAQFLVTGSARLDVYRRGGDSLLGRYHYWRLHPFGFDEYPDKFTQKEVFKRLMTIGGFPEPFLDGDEREARRWRRERFDRVLKEDIRDLEYIRHISLLDLFIHQFRTRVGSLIVMSNIAGEIQVSPKTVNKWLTVLERMYLVFAVRSYTKNLPRAVIKPPKVFFYDNGDVIGNEGAVFENLVASHLLKKNLFLEDRDGFRYELRYIRDKEGREVDFVILKEGMIEELIEVKFADNKISKHLKYYAEKLNPPKVTQIVAKLKHPYSSGKINVVEPATYFRQKSG